MLTKGVNCTIHLRTYLVTYGVRSYLLSIDKSRWRKLYWSLALIIFVKRLLSIFKKVESKARRYLPISIKVSVEPIWTCKMLFQGSSVWLLMNWKLLPFYNGTVSFVIKCATDECNNAVHARFTDVYNTNTWLSSSSVQVNSTCVNADMTRASGR